MLTRVTLSGADDHVDPGALRDLSAEFPFVEWGILFSRSRAGTSRYPKEEWVYALNDLADSHPMNLSAHLCGARAREVLAGAFWDPPSQFTRMQINGYRSPLDESLLWRARTQRHVEIILQVSDLNELFDAAEDVRRLPLASILYDVSCGRGISPFEWPREYPAGVRVGFAGGLGPDNVREMLPAVDHNYWVDMESRIRDDSSDRLDLQKVRAVLETLAPLISP